MPMVRAPPGRLSTTTDCPSWRASSGATRRATLSVALPGACGTTKRIGRQCGTRSEEHTSELQSPCNLVCRLLLEKKKNTQIAAACITQTAVRHPSHSDPTVYPAGDVNGIPLPQDHYQPTETEAVAPLHHPPSAFP